MPAARRPRAASRYDWARVKTAGGNLPPAVYLCTPNPMVSLNVFRDGRHWRWVVIGFSTADSHVLRSGTALSMHEAIIYAEAALGTIGHPQQDFGFTEEKDGHNDNDSDLPF